MKSPDGITVPSWKDIGPVPARQAPPSELTADVCIVGAGIAGLTTAYLLAKEGKSVVVLDEGPIGAGQTERTSAHLASAVDDRFYEIEKHHGLDGSKISYESHASAIDTIERITRDEEIECDFKRIDGYLFALPSDPPDELDKELQAAQRAGFPGVKKFERVTLAGYETGPCLQFPRQARFHPLKYLYGLAAALERRGGRIFTGCRVKDVQGSDPKKGTRCRATIDDGPGGVTSDAIVVATNTPAPINGWMGIYTKQASYRTYMIAAEVPVGLVTDALYWDNGDPYHYVRLEEATAGAPERKGHDLLLVGGEDHKTGQMPKGDPYQNLEAWTLEKFPMIGRVVRRWSGQVQEPADYVAYIGKAPGAGGEEVYVITGDSGMGLTHGTMGGIICTDLIQKRQNPWAALYDPTRKTLDADFIKENVNVVAQYADLITGGDVKSVDEIPAGEGAVIREGLHKLAVYRAPDGAVTKCSALCTHLKCVVQWNGFEKTWDCPCHGSRFDPKGKVIMGPAIDDLPPAE